MKQILMACVLLAGTAAFAATVIETEKVKPLKPTGSLGTCQYKPTPAETTYFSKLGKKEAVTGSFMEPYSIHKKVGMDVGWFAVVRGITRDPNSENWYTLLLEQKFFDGLTDCHIMLVSMAGGGDFRASVQAEEAKSIPLLSLVRVYGKVVQEESGVSVVTADYIRVWPWMTFTFTDLGPSDEGNPKWRKLCKVCSGRIYVPYPTETYYRQALGDPKDFSEPAK